MNGVNLIPLARLHARRGMARLRVWMTVGPISLGLLVAAYLINFMAWDTDTRPVEAALRETEQRIADADKKIALSKKLNEEEQAIKRANRSVGEQPDWGSLLTLLGACLGEDAALVACAVEPVVEERGTKTDKEAAKPAGRPQRLRLSVQGVSRTQEAASRFVVELERTALFDKVNLVETKRKDTNQADVDFRVTCELSDSGALSK